jgi:hypothetical protein
MQSWTWRVLTNTSNDLYVPQPLIHPWGVSDKHPKISLLHLVVSSSPCPSADTHIFTSLALSFPERPIVEVYGLQVFRLTSCTWWCAFKAQGAIAHPLTLTIVPSSTVRSRSIYVIAGSCVKCRFSFVKTDNPPSNMAAPSCIPTSPEWDFPLSTSWPALGSAWSASWILAIVLGVCLIGPHLAVSICTCPAVDRGKCVFIYLFGICTSSLARCLLRSWVFFFVCEFSCRVFRVLCSL